jgi:hypothetical protein
VAPLANFNDRLKLRQQKYDQQKGLYDIMEGFAYYATLANFVLNVGETQKDLYLFQGVGLKQNAP